MERTHIRKIKGKDPKLFSKNPSESQTRDAGSRQTGKDGRHFLGVPWLSVCQVVWGRIVEEHGPRNSATGVRGNVHVGGS